MARTEVLQFRLSPEEMAKLRAAADARGWTMAQLLRDMVRRLPEEQPDRPEGHSSPS